MPPHMEAVGRCSQVCAKARGGASKREVTLVSQKLGEKQKKPQQRQCRSASHPKLARKVRVVLAQKDFHMSSSNRSAI